MLHIAGGRQNESEPVYSNNDNIAQASLENGASPPSNTTTAPLASQPN